MQLIIGFAVTALLAVHFGGVPTTPASFQEMKSLESSGRKFGGEFTDAKLVTLRDVLERPEGFEGKPVKLEGTIAEVCQAEGCWLTLAEGERQITVNMARHSFFVPKNSSGQHVLIEGKVVRKMLTKEQIEERRAEGAKSLKTVETKDGAALVLVEATTVLIRAM